MNLTIWDLSLSILGVIKRRKEEEEEENNLFLFSPFRESKHRIIPTPKLFACCWSNAHHYSWKFALYFTKIHDKNSYFYQPLMHMWLVRSNYRISLVYLSTIKFFFCREQRCRMRDMLNIPNGTSIQLMKIIMIAKERIGKLIEMSSNEIIWDFFDRNVKSFGFLI